MCQWKILLMVAVGGCLAQATKTPLTNNGPSVLGDHGDNQHRSIHTGRAEDTHRSKNGQVKGEYSYMDGFYKVKVVYTAGPNGFRVIRQERIPLKKLKQVTTQSPHQSDIKSSS